MTHKLWMKQYLLSAPVVLITHWCDTYIKFTRNKFQFTLHGCRNYTLSRGCFIVLLHKRSIWIPVICLYFFNKQSQNIFILCSYCHVEKWCHFRLKFDIWSCPVKSDRYFLFLATIFKTLSDIPNGNTFCSKLENLTPFPWNCICVFDLLFYF